jgi:hypothetical protein
LPKHSFGKYYCKKKGRIFENGHISGERKHRLQAYTDALPMAFSVPMKKWRDEYA